MYKGKSNKKLYEKCDISSTIEKVHQGDSETLTINAIVSELIGRSKKKHIQTWAYLVLQEINVFDLTFLGLNLSPIPIVPGTVREEGSTKKTTDLSIQDVLFHQNIYHVNKM